MRVTHVYSIYGHQYGHRPRYSHEGVVYKYSARRVGLGQEVKGKIHVWSSGQRHFSPVKNLDPVAALDTAPMGVTGDVLTPLERRSYHQTMTNAKSRHRLSLRSRLGGLPSRPVETRVTCAAHSSSRMHLYGP